MDTDLAASGAARITWIRSRMPLLAEMRAQFAEERPFEGLRIGMSLHVEPKTAVLLETLAAGGAEVVGTGNHGSTQDDVVAALRAQGLTIFGTRDDSLDQHHANLESVLDSRPQILLDNGADLAAGVVRRGIAGDVRGGTEETTSGAFRLRDELEGQVPFPVLVINDSPLKAIGENLHAVGQSAVESFQRITNLMIPGRRFVVVGYGWCGRGVARYLRALGGQVAVAEVDEIKAFEAALDGYLVDDLANLLPDAQAVITATGHPNVLPAALLPLLPSGTVLGNIGHFPFEIDTAALAGQAVSRQPLDEALEVYTMADGREIVLIAEGRMFNLAGRAPKGNSIASMDLGFTLQVRSLERVAVAPATLQAGAQPIPDDINRSIARRMVEVMRTGS
ncbi:adenosylhomocysteinase [Naasia sp. SYSU D00057]|uniref:adenosylhomocysteinase n=1 Tax=Naasia sp. SYSU D00057 TaxID=2817380 RepID=UPI001B31363C|nr:adenosylhomocysteinase [Naasia sp. SYSU D00057]